MKTNAQINTCAPFLCNQWWSGGLRHTTHKHVIPKDSIVFECKIIFFMTMFFLAFISYSSKLYLHYLFIRKQNLSAMTAGQKCLTSSIKTKIFFYLRANCFRVQNNFCYDNFFWLRRIFENRDLFKNLLSFPILYGTGTQRNHSSAHKLFMKF